MTNTDQKNKIEALLYAAGKRLPLEELQKLTQLSKELVLHGLRELQQDYQNRDTALVVIEEGDFWKLSVKTPYVSLIRTIVSETELDKGTLETLAVIAFKYPILQSDLIKIRTNKAYDHISMLEETGYITRQRYGRTRLIKLTQKFFEYFDLAEEDLKEKFRDFESIAKAIEIREETIEQQKTVKKDEAQ